MMDLTGRAVIVTGSSSGIGEAIARRLAGLGAGIVVNSATSVEAGTQVAAEPARRRVRPGRHRRPGHGGRADRAPPSSGGDASTAWSTTPA